MSLINPQYYHDQYQNTRDLTDKQMKQSTTSGNLDATAINYNMQWDYDNAWYDAHESASAKFDEYAKLGINPLSISRMLLGNPASDTGGSVSPVTGSGTQDYFSTLASLFGSGLNAGNQALQTNIDSEVSQAQIANLDSQTALNNATVPTIQPESASRVHKNTAEAASAAADVPVKESTVGVLNAQQKELISKSNLNDREAAEIEQRMSRFNDVTDAQISHWSAENHLWFEQARTQANVRQNLDADTLLKGAQTSETVQNTQNLVTMEEGQAIENTIRLQYAEFAASLGAPLEASDYQIVQSYIDKGQFDKAENYMMTMFDCAAHREAGTQQVQVQAQAAKDYNRAKVENDWYIPQDFRNAINYHYNNLRRFNNKYYYPNFGRTFINP